MPLPNASVSRKQMPPPQSLSADPAPAGGLPGRSPHHDALATGRTILALVLREMTTRYGRSPGGYLWAILEPVGSILLLSIAFALIARHPPLGTSFLLYFATGMLPFSLYTNLDNSVSRSLSFSKPLLMYPAVRWIDAILARFLLNTLTKLVIIAIVLSGTLLLTETRTVLDFRPILAALGMAALLGLGMGLLNCALDGLFPAWDMIWAIATRPLFLASGVILLYEDLPPTIQAILWWNPLLHITGEMRSGFYPMYTAAYVSIGYVSGIALGLMVLGLLLVRRYHLTILRE